MTTPAAIAHDSHPLRWFGAAAWFAPLSFLLVCAALQLLRGELDWRYAQLSAYLHAPYGLLLRTFHVVMALVVLAILVRAGLHLGLE